MSGVEVVLGAFGTSAALSQLAGQCINLFAAVADVRQKMKNGHGSVREDYLRIQQFIQLATKIQQNPDQTHGVTARPFIDNVLEGAHLLQEVLHKVSISNGDGAYEKFKKALKWKIKEKRISDLCAILEREKTSLHTSLLFDIHNATLTTDTKQNASVVSKTEVQAGRCTLNATRNMPLIGHEKLVEEILSKILRNEHTRIALCGLSGVGKSRLALECAFLAREVSLSFSTFLIDAKSCSSFEHDFLKICAPSKESCLDSSTSTNQLPRLNDVKDWLEARESGSWLIIVDGADESSVLFEQNNLLRLLPRNPAGSILFTTRNKQLAMNMAVSDNITILRDLGFIEAQQMLLQYMGKNCFTESETRHAITLLEHLGHLPLAIAHAGSFMCANSMAISVYLQLYNENEASKTILLDRMPNIEQLKLFNVDEPQAAVSIAITLMVSINKIRKEDPEAAGLLFLMSCFGSQQIPRGLLCTNRTLESRLRLSKSLGILKGYFVISGNEEDELFNMNILVHTAIQHQLHIEGSLEMWQQRAFVSVAEKFTFTEELNNDSFNLCELYLLHAEAVLDYQGIQTEHIERAKLADRCSQYLIVSGRYRQSERLARIAINSGLHYFGEAHQFTLALKSNLGLAVHRLGRYEEAEQIHRDVLRYREAILGMDNEETLATMSNLTWSLQWQRKFSAAKEMGEKVVRLKRRVLGPKHYRTLISLNMYGTILQDHGDLEEAEVILAEVLKIREHQLGSKHSATLVTKGNIAILLYEQCKFQEAEDMLRQVLDASNEIRGPRHPESLRCLFNLSEIVLQLNRHDEAVDLRRQVLEVRQEILGPEHPETQTADEALRVLVESRLIHTHGSITNQFEYGVLQRSQSGKDANGGTKPKGGRSEREGNVRTDSEATSSSNMTMSPDIFPRLPTPFKSKTIFIPENQ